MSVSVKAFDNAFKAFSSSATVEIKTMCSIYAASGSILCLFRKILHSCAAFMLLFAVETQILLLSSAGKKDK